MAPSSQMRWQLADDPTGQGELFDQVYEREPGRGEFRGLEFLHVRARRIINEVPKASRMPFRYTINAYRGCSHACSYCLRGDTPVLMADGTTRPIEDLRVGDEIYGTKNQRLVPTTVEAHWSTVKPATEVRLDDGRSLVASADHRFLTDTGWTHVCDLQPAVKAVTLGTASTAGWELVVVESVRPLGVEIPMYDITTGTGDFIANGVVSHNCFARPTHEYLNLDAGRDFETKIVVKLNAVERLRAELDPRRWRGDHIAMGTNTDPYQRCEGKYHLTEGIIEVLSGARNPFSILTKSTLILRDIDLLREASQRTEVGINFSIGTLDEEVWKLSEAGTPHPARRVEAVAKLNEAGVRCGVLVAPILPGLSDRPDQIEEVVKACADAGATSISGITLHLRRGVREQFMPWLEEKRPDLVGQYQRLYPRSYAPKAEQNRVSGMIREAAERHGGRRVSPAATRQVTPAEPDPDPERSSQPQPEQLGLSF